MVSKKIKFSIVIPAYKSIFLKECIDSILEQSYTNFELIIVDDDSPQHLYSIVSMYDDPRIKYYKNETNYGAVDVVKNWNKCVDYASGDYLICMGDDDKLLPNCLSEYLNLIEKYPNYGVYHAWTEFINSESVVIGIQEPRPIHESVYSLIWFRWSGRKQFIGDFLFDLKLLKGNGGFYYIPLAWASDDISSYIAAKNTGIVNSQIPLFQYRFNDYTISNTENSSIKIKSIDEEKKWMQNFLLKEPDDKIDIVLWTCINKDFEHHYLRKKIGELMALRHKSFIKIIIYFIRNKKAIASNSIIIFVLFEIFRLKFKEYIQKMYEK